MMTKNLTFHIIYTPGTVKYLRLFTCSLLKWLPCSFRLVPNGCSQEEIQLLRIFAKRYSQQVELFLLPWEMLRSHSKALNYLQRHESSDFFCFLDSDILATGNFLNDLADRLQESDVIFSGMPFWQDATQCVWKNYLTEISGLHATAEDGGVLGTTFFAIYKNRMLTECISSTGISLKAYTWPKIPETYQEMLVRIGRKARYYDTAKLLNIVLRERGAALSYQHLSSLQHIGGFSAVAARKMTAKQYFKLFKGSLNAFRDWIFYQRSFYYFQRYLQQIEAYKRYFSSLLRHLFDKTPLAQMPKIDRQQREQLEWITAQICLLYDEFKDDLGEK